MNRLHLCTSPYLLQHASNPVHWQPWDAQALQQAKEQDRPILLSVGYAACHWCHVMEHESFESEATAALMNEHFINIKIDREERPDLDRIYQAAHYLFTRRNGGWPLTMFLAPDGTPFFGGTYFPFDARHGMPSFSEVLQRVASAWQTQRAAITQQNENIVEILNRLDSFPAFDSNAGEMTDAPVRAATAALSELIDREKGGLGNAPKFPHSLELSFCLEQAILNDDKPLAAAAYDSLIKIANSGLIDHIGGGAFRYCVDEYWFIPHFEKMLYDNGQLLAAFAEAHAHQPDARLQVAINGIVAWLQNEMMDEHHCFYSSLDADTDEGEGAFYLWAREELDSVLSADELAVVLAHFGVEAGGMLEGKYHLSRRQTLAQTAAALQQNEAQTQQHLTAAMTKLAVHRNTRQRPRLDNKILCASNALAIIGLARAGRLCKQSEWIAMAQRTFFSVEKRLRNNERTLAYVQTDSAIGFLDDCAFLLAAALELLRADVDDKINSNTRTEILQIANSLAQELKTHYYDEEAGAFYFCPNDGETLIRRLKVVEDTAIPSGNGIAICSLLTLSELTGEAQWASMAKRSLQTFYRHLSEHPSSSCSLARALQMLCNKT